MNLTKEHAKGLAGVGGGLASIIGSALVWAQTHVQPTADGVCLVGMPPTVVMVIGGGIGILATIAGAWKLLFTPSAAAPKGTAS